MNLDWNDIAVIDTNVFLHLVNLHYLNLERNKISLLPLGVFSCLRSLLNLLLNDNHLQRLEPGIFLGMTKLETLYLSRNMIQVLESRTFDGLVNLQFLYLSGNNLQSLSENAFLVQGGIFVEHTCRTNKNFTLQERNTIMAMETQKTLKLVSLTENDLIDFSFQSFKDLINVSVEVDHDWLCCFLEDSHCVVPNRERKTTNFLTCNRLLPNPIAMVLLLIFGCLAVIGNVSVIIWQLCSKAHKKVQPLLITNLAIADFLMGIYMLIIASADVYYGDYFPAKTETWRNSSMCLAASTLAMVSSESSILLVTLISLDRLMGIRFTFSKLTVIK